MQGSHGWRRRASLASIVLMSVAGAACGDSGSDKAPAVDAGGDGDGESQSDAGEQLGDGDGDSQSDAGEQPGDGDGAGDGDGDGENPPVCEPAFDADCDGIPTEEDCDDADPMSPAKSTDADCDGIPNAQDCEVSTPSTLQRDESGSCDPVIVFRKEDGADTTLPENQDCWSPSICITRGDTKGWFNAAAASEYEPGEPSGLRFARGYQGEDLTFTTWTDSFRGSQMAFQPAAVSFADGSEHHNLFMVLWTPAGGGGGFGYARSRSVAFEKPAFADFTQAENQDCITDKVCIARKDTQSIFNSVTESGYSGGSPSGTEWALGPTFGNTSNYKTFVDLSQNDPSSLIGKVLSLHITGTNLYYDVVFKSWGGGGSGGGFSYVRTRALVPGCMEPEASNYDPRATVPTPCGDWFMFNKPNHADPAFVQDCITDDVCLTRGDDGGLYNATLTNEDVYSCSASAPTGTSWSLSPCAEATTFGSYRDIACGPRKLLYKEACLYIPSADRYFDIQLLSHSGQGGGGFTDIRKEYVRK